jgi:uncharacterized membrane protein
MMILTTGKAEQKEQKELKWRTQDWIWLLAVIIYAQGLVFLHNELLMQAISYVSTFVSIALAGIAIYISIKEATNNDDVKTEIYIALNEMRSKIGDINTKIDSFNPSEFQQITIREVTEKNEQLSNDVKEVLRQALEQNEGTEVDFEQIINDKIESNTRNLIASLNYVQEEYINDNLSSSVEVRNPFYDVIQTYEIGEEFTIDGFHRRMRNIGTLYSKDYIRQRLANFRNEGYLEKKQNIFIRRK